MPNIQNALSILSACYDGINNPDFEPQIHEDNTYTTFCNLFIESVAKRIGYEGFQGLVANDMVDLMSASPDWTAIELEQAQALANKGTFVIAAQKASPHGHVNVVVPGLAVRSIHWSSLNPVCANVGKDVFIGKGLSFAFRERPMTFAWRKTL